MNELPIDPRAQSQAILALEAQVRALRLVIGALVADNAEVLGLLKKFMSTTLIEDVGGASMLTDTQLQQLRGEIGAVLENVAHLHASLGIDAAKRPHGS